MRDYPRGEAGLSFYWHMCIAVCAGWHPPRHTTVYRIHNIICRVWASYTHFESHGGCCNHTHADICARLRCWQVTDRAVQGMGILQIRLLISNPAGEGCLLLSGWKIGTITCKHRGNGCGASKAGCREMQVSTNTGGWFTWVLLPPVFTWRSNGTKRCRLRSQMSHS